MVISKEQGENGFVTEMMIILPVAWFVYVTKRANESNVSNVLEFLKVDFPRPTKV